MVNVEGVGSPRPSQTAIGRALGLSPAAITKLKKLGMPVESAEAAQAWRVARQNVAARKPLPERAAAGVDSAGAAVNAAGALDGGDAQVVSAEAVRDAARARRVVAEANLAEAVRDAARARREVAEANLAELAEARQRRELIEVRAVQDRLAHDYATTRDALLQLPARMGPVLAAETDPAAVERMLYAEIHAALVQLAGAASAVPQADGGET